MRTPNDRPTRNEGHLHWIGDGPEPGDWRDRLARVPSAPPRVGPVAPPIDPDLRDRGLRTILAAGPLSVEHWTALAGRGLTEEQIARHGYATLPADQGARRRVAAAVVASCGPAAYGQVPGLYRDPDGAPNIHGAPGLLAPSRDVDGRVQGLRVRTESTGGKWRWVSSPDLPGGVGSGAPCHVAMPPTRPAVNLTAVVTEGEVKGYVVADHHGMPAIALPGVAVIGDAVAILHELGISQVLIATDGDRETNPTVAAADRRLVEELRGAGLHVARLAWDTEYKGIDDALLAGNAIRVEPIDAGATEASAETCGDLTARLHRENARLRADLEEKGRTIATLVQTATNNRNLGDSGGAVAILLAADLNRQAAARPTADGFYNINPATIANAWTDPSGEEPARPAIISESTVRRYTKKHHDAGLLEIEYRPATKWVTVPDKHTGELKPREIGYDEPWARFVGSVAGQLDPFARYQDPDRPNRGGARPRTKVAVFPTICPDCGEALTAACHGCGAIAQPIEIDISDGDRARVEPAVLNADDAHEKSRGQVDAPRYVTEGEALASAPTNAAPPITRDQVERGSERLRPNADDAHEKSRGQVDRGTARRRPTSDDARADLAAREAAAPKPAVVAAQALLTAATRATDPDAARRALDDLGDQLGDVARATGRHPNPRPPCAAPPDRYTDISSGARP